MASDLSRRRIRFYKPPSQEASVDTQKPQASIPRNRSFARRFAEASPTVAQSQRTAEIISSASTPASRTTPETLRTLELNWRERRRAKLEDITLQRAMGVETRTLEAPRRPSLEARNAAEESQLPTRLDAESARRTQTSPTAPLKVDIAIAESDPIRVPGSTSAAYSQVPKQRLPRNQVSNVSQARPSLALTANNTTYQTRTNRARKIVKLVRDARHSVKAGNDETKSISPPYKKVFEVEMAEKRQPLAEKSNQSPAPSSKCTRHAPAPSAQSATARTPGLPTQPATPRPMAIPRRVSEVRSGRHTAQVRGQNPPQRSLRSFTEYRTEGSSAEKLQSITASPLPSREYPLTATSSLIIYPYGQDWSVDFDLADIKSTTTKNRRRRYPIMSAVTVSERMDILDDGKTMRIKPSRTNATGSRQSRYLELRHAAHWDPADRRRWLTVSDLVQRLKAKTRRSTTDLPQGALHVMCNDPPDIVFYTDIVEPPPVPITRRADGDVSENICDTSAFLSATTDIFHLCRSRILYSPSRGILKLSTRYGPSSSEIRDEYDTRSLMAKTLPPNPSDQTFRSKRIINLPATASTSMVNQIRELYGRKKAALLATHAPGSEEERKYHQLAFPQDLWHAREVQTLGRFLKLEDAWTPMV